MAHHRRKSRLRRILSMVGGVSFGVLLFAGSQIALASGGASGGFGLANWPLPQQVLFPPAFLNPSTSYTDFSIPRRVFPVRRTRTLRRRTRRSPPLPDTGKDAVLLPDGEFLVLSDEPVSDAFCSFKGGASSPARPLGMLPGPGRHAYSCVPDQSIQPLEAPLLFPSSAAAAAAAHPDEFPRHKLLNWSEPLVFDSAALEGGELLVFAKGVNRRQGESIADVHCVYGDDADGVLASFPAITSAQQVIRCPSPAAPLHSGNTPIRVTLGVAGEDLIPSVATYTPHHHGVVSGNPRSLICACTMVRDVSKVLREWVEYHAAVGVERFFLYDNGSEDDLADLVRKLNAEGIIISTVAWPWTKTQEAGLSHCAAVHQKSCQWMGFFDVDEFIFSPHWTEYENPSKSLLEPVVSVAPQIGQIYLGCLDFGPSGQTAHPQEGISQGYTCRMKDVKRHKSLVRLDAVGHSLVNVVHHFSLKPGFNSTWTTLARINHYKFQAWPEFKLKFRRRVSTYVADWTNAVNLQSNDRAPGLGVEAIEPVGWSAKFCEVKDYLMKELTEKWFGIGFGGHGSGAELKPTVSDETSTGEIAPAPSVP